MLLLKSTKENCTDKNVAKEQRSSEKWISRASVKSSEEGVLFVEWMEYPFHCAKDAK